MNPTYIPAKTRAVIYVVFAVVGIVLGSLAVGFSAADAGHPVWLAVCEAVYAYLGGALGYTAATNVAAPRRAADDE